MMRIALVDDEPLALRRLQIKLERVRDVEVCGMYTDGEAALEAIPDSQPDAMFVDIRMPGMDGFDLADAIHRIGGPALIFVTAFDDFAVRAFEARALDYLIKPVEDARLQETLDRLRNHDRAQQAGEQVQELRAIIQELRTKRSPRADAAHDIWVKDRGRVVRIRQSNIDWIEAERDYVRIHVGDQSWLLRATMAQMGEQLEAETFVRVHRSAIVNIDAITQSHTQRSGARTLTLRGGEQVRVGRSYSSALQQCLHARQ